MFKHALLNPRKYFAYDVSNFNCKDCGSGKLYQVCKHCKNVQSCAGFADDKGDYCCDCYVTAITQRGRYETS